MPPETMKALAALYISHPPGDALRQVARYVHDCMRDPGLFAGLETTTPPTSIAMRLYQSWAQHVGELIIAIWGDVQFPESYAEEFTVWAISELLPSPPRVLDQRMQATIASLTSLTVMTAAMLQGANSNERERINRGLRAMAAALGVAEAEYVDTIAKVTSAASR